MHAAALEHASAVSSLVQGEVLAVPDACVVVADAGSPLDERSALQKEESGLVDGLFVVPHEVDEVVVLSQTCDLQFTTATDYLCLLAPVVVVEPVLAREALRGHRPGLAALPWLGDDRVADLARITTVERSVIAGQSSVGKPRSAQERLDFAESVRRYLTRAALPDEIVTVLKPFLKRIQERHDKNSDEGRCLNLVLELRLSADPDLDDPSPALCVLVILNEVDLPSLSAGVAVDDERIDQLVEGGVAMAARAVVTASSAVTLREGWTALAELWVQASVVAAEHEPRVGSVSVEVLNDEELSYARSRRSPVLDLRYLSSRAA